MTITYQLRRLTLTLFTVLATATTAFADRPNILLIMAEDMSARVGAFGDKVAVTPHLDRLAKEGVRYPNTFTTSGTCAPSRAAHILGMHQAATGTQHMRTDSGPQGSYRSVPPEHVKAYPELLRAAGYETFNDGKLDYQFSGPMEGSGPFTIWDIDRNKAHWRELPGKAPFFGFISLLVSHESGVFTPLGNWPNNLFHFVMQVLRPLRMERGELDESTAVRPENIVLEPYYPDTTTVRRDISRHYHNIQRMDDYVGSVLRQLEEDGLADDTIVIWTTDHGDGLPRAKRELYDSGIRVPMIIRWPERWRPTNVLAGDIDERLISFVDLAPTILALAGAEVPKYFHGSDFRDSRRRYIFAAGDRIDEIEDRQRAVRDDRYKYIRSDYPLLPGSRADGFRENIDMMREMRELHASGQLNPLQQIWFQAPGAERLYDLHADPFELNNLSANPEYAEHRARLSAALDNWLEKIGKRYEIPEAELVAIFEPGGSQVHTAAPLCNRKEGKVLIQAEHSASIGYRFNSGPWSLYTDPIAADRGDSVEAKAVRYGWQESDTVACP